MPSFSKNLPKVTAGGRLADGVAGAVGGFMGGLGRLQWCRAGPEVHAASPLLPVVALALLVPALFGAQVYVGLSEAAFRKLVLSLLSLSGLALLTSAVPRLVG